VNLVIELTKYLMILLLGIYTYYSFQVMRYKSKERQELTYRVLTVLIFALHFAGNFTLYIQVQSDKLILLYVSEVVMLILTLSLYQKFYKRISKLLLRNMLMLMSIGFIVLSRLAFDKAEKQVSFAAISLLACLVIPGIIHKFSWLMRIGWIYGVAGITILLIVLVAGTTQYGATNWLEIWGFSFQPSEFVKLLFIFSIASLFNEGTDFKRICAVAAMAGATVIILVFQKDLGGALIFFVTFVFMVYIARQKSIYLFGGLLSGSVAAYIAYQLFGHVRVRVMAWQNPLLYIDNEGYQISQSLFAIGTGGWVGMGLNRGLPTDIPVVDSDFIFSAIAEEFGALFAISVILIYLNIFVNLINISLKQEDHFYRLLSFGCSIMLIFQVFLSFGGVIKFIPSTGVTLPLISYGGSSMFATIIMFMIIQGIHIRGRVVTSKEYNQNYDQKVSLENKQKAAEADNASVSSNKMKNTIYRVVYIFIGLFVLGMGYFSYFIIFRKNDVINSAYNKRQEVLTERVLRGDILSIDGEVLARTIIDLDGGEIREYPFGEIYAPVVGRTLMGRAGIEETENIRLLTSNINPIEQMYYDLSGEKSPGDNVVTTLDSKLTQVAYEALSGYRGAIVVMEPSTGKILAMVSNPSYDPNTIEEDWRELVEDERKESALLNRAAQGLYPPGSTYKLLTTLGYIRQNPTFEKYSYDCDGSIEENGMVIRDYSKKGHGKVDLTTSLAKSCNTSFSHIGRLLDLDAFYAMNEEFLFNRDLPVNMATSRSSFTLKKAGSSVKEAMQTAIGQGKTLMTPLHNAMIISSIANGGAMMRPYLVDHVETADGGIVKTYSSELYSKPMTAVEADYLGKMMREAVVDGTGRKLKDMEVTSAGKTGSADNSTGKAHSWFVGYAPYENPQISVSILVENVGTGSEYAVPIAKKIFEAYFQE